MRLSARSLGNNFQLARRSQTANQSKRRMDSWRARDKMLWIPCELISKLISLSSLILSSANFLLLSHLLSCNCCSLLAEKRKWTRRPEDGETRRKNSESCPFIACVLLLPLLGCSLLAGTRIQCEDTSRDLAAYRRLESQKAEEELRVNSRKNRHAIPSLQAYDLLISFAGFLMHILTM